jgi:UDP-4-amino-4,6-dideoxy-N-acetyl-beta-L-altrosamine transaminase
MIPYGRQDISEEDIAAVVAVLRSDWMTQGPAIERFERAILDTTGCKHAVAVANATAALHLSMIALDLGPGDILWTSPNTFVATANAALYCGAVVDFVDIDPDTYCMSISSLREKLENAVAEGKKLPKVVAPVHFAGQCCGMREIRDLSRQYGFRIVEDASHAIGADYLGQKVGNCAYSDICVFSFHPVKIVTTGEGGAVTTNNPDLARRVRELRSHGTTRDQARMKDVSDGPWFYQMIDLGFNYRMTDMQAALGTSQMSRLAGFVARRRELADRYRKKLDGLSIVLPAQSPEGKSAFHLYPVQVLAAHRRGIYDAMRSDGIGVNVHYIPVHTQPVYHKLGFRPGQFPNAERYYSRALSLPMFSKMSEDEQDTVVDALARILEQVSSGTDVVDRSA